MSGKLIFLRPRQLPKIHCLLMEVGVGSVERQWQLPGAIDHLFYVQNESLITVADERKGKLRWILKCQRQRAW